MNLVRSNSAASPGRSRLSSVLVLGFVMGFWGDAACDDEAPVKPAKSPFMMIVRADSNLGDAARRGLAALGCEAYVVRAEERARFGSVVGDRFLIDGILDDAAFALDDVLLDRIFDAYLATRDPNATVRPRCLRREPARTQIDERATAARNLLRTDPLALLLPQEMSWTHASDPLDLCYCEACVRAWRDELIARFGDAPTAARRLGIPPVRDISELGPATVDRIRARNDGRALGDARLGAWLDYRRSLDRGLASRLTEIANSMSPQRFPFVGWLGGEPTNPFGGHDWSLLGRVLSIVMPPDDPTSREVVYSLASSGTAPLVLVDLRSAGGRDRFIRRRLIEQFFHGARGSFTPNAAFLVDAEGKRTPFAENVAPRLAWLDGPGAAQWIEATPESPRVGILYSPTSVAVHWLIDAEPDGIYWPGRARGREGEILPMVGTWWGWQLLLEDLGLPYRYVPEQDLASSGALDDLAALILPRVIALSDADAARIQEFAAKGGRVLIDGECGAFDELGNGRARGPFDESCGVERSNLRYWDERARPEEPSPQANTAVSAASRLRDLETNVAVTAEPNSNPRWIDLAIEDYVVLRGADAGAIPELRADLARSLAPASVDRGIRLTRRDGKSPLFVRQFFAASEGVRYLALVRNDLLPEFTSGPNVTFDDAVIDYVLELDREASVEDLSQDGAAPRVTRRIEFSLPADGFALFRIAPP